MLLAFVMSGAHLHLALNHLPIIGVGCALVPLALALLWRDRKVLIAALALTFLTAAPVPLVMATGDAAYDELTEGDGSPTSLTMVVDKEGRRWAHVHDERAEKAALALYALAVVAALGLVCTWKLPAWQFRAGAAALVLTLLALGLSLWVADAGGRIHHPEFRDAVSAGGEATSTDAETGAIAIPPISVNVGVGVTVTHVVAPATTAPAPLP